MFRLSSKRNQMMSQNSQLKPLLSMEEYSLQRTKRIIKMGLTIQILLLLMCVWLVVLQPSGPSEPCLTTNDSSPSASSPIIPRSEEHTSELQSLMRISYAVFCLTHKNKIRSKVCNTI